MKKRLKFLVWRFSCCLFFQTMEPVDQLLQCVDPTKDRETWVRENKTGEIRPVDIEIWYRRYLMNSHPDTASSRLRAGGEEVCAGIFPLPRMHTLICMWFLTDWGTVSLCWAILYVLTAPLLTMISVSEGVFLRDDETCHSFVLYKLLLVPSEWELYVYSLVKDA